MASRDRDDRATRPRIYLFAPGIRLERANPRFCFTDRGPRKSRDRRLASLSLDDRFSRGGVRGMGPGCGETTKPPILPCSRYPRAWNFIVETLAEFVPLSRSLINGCGWKVFFGFISSLVATLASRIWKIRRLKIRIGVYIGE